MLTFRLAFRNVFRQKRRTLLTVLTMLGGFAMASISIAWSDGTYSRIIDMFTRNRIGHIQVHSAGYLDRPSLYKTIDHYRQVGRVIAETKGVVAWAPRLLSAGIVQVGDKSATAQIIGIDPTLERRATRFDKKIIEGQPLATEASHQVVLGDMLADLLKARVGDTALIVSQGADGSIANDLYVIAGTASSGDDMTDRSAFYLHISDAQELLVQPDQAHEIVIVANDIDDVEDMILGLAESLDNSNLAIDSWQTVAKSFYDAMRVDQEGNAITLFVIMLVVAVGVLNTVLMTVLERTREYGMLRAVGTQPMLIIRLVLYEVFFMAVISIVLGIFVALPGNYLLMIYGIKMPQALSYGGVTFSHLYSELNIRSYVIPAITVVISALVVGLFPAIRAARTAPARAMRMH
ncbi:MAG: ABC transporter permease [Candidatus Zixiibacteriota bacterium]